MSFPLLSNRITSRTYSGLARTCLQCAALLGALALCRLHPASASLRVAEGSPHAALWQRIYNKLPDCWRAERTILVEEVSAEEMARLVEQSGASERGYGDDGDTEIDGCYRNDGAHDDDPVTITLRESLRGEEAALVFTHEYGHFVWDEKLSEAQRARYEKLWRKQRRAHHLVTDYAAESGSEGFAEAFSFYLRKPAFLRRRDSASWQFLHDAEQDASRHKAMDDQN